MLIAKSAMVLPTIPFGKKNPDPFQRIAMPTEGNEVDYFTVASQIPPQMKAIGCFPAGWRHYFEHVESEHQELRKELQAPVQDSEKVESELGDLLFTTGMLASELGINPQQALRNSIERFKARMNALRQKADENKVRVNTPQLFREYWNFVKAELAS